MIVLSHLIVDVKGKDLVRRKDLLLVSTTFCKIPEGLRDPLCLSPCPELQHSLYILHKSYGSLPLIFGVLFCFLHIFVLLTSHIM